MLVDLRRLEGNQGQLSADEVVPYTDAFDIEREIRCHVELSYKRSGGAYFFHGELAGEFQTQCHRCLDDVSYRLTGDFDVVVRKGSERDGESDSDADELFTVPLNVHEVSFDRWISENLIVNVPMQILCREDCKGMCPQCGINRNKESCTCTEPADPRWDALRKLKNE